MQTEGHTMAEQSDTIQALRLAGRCANGAERDGGSIWHAVRHQAWAALCGAAPGRRSAGWSTHVGEYVTCPKCLRKLHENPPPRRQRKPKRSPYQTCAERIMRALLALEKAVPGLDTATLHHAERFGEGRIGPWMALTALREADYAGDLFDGIRSAVRS